MVDAILNTDIDISQIPNDPLHVDDASTDTYYYAVISQGARTGKKYILGARLEDPNNPQLRQDIDDENIKNLGDYSGDLPDGSCDDPIYCVEL
jgi:hypothetical protein